MGHAKFSPSSAYRWLKCPGSVNMSLMVPERETNSAAKIGTLIHTIAEEFLLMGWDTLKAEHFNDALNIYDHGLNDEEIQQFKHSIEIYIQSLNEIIKKNDPTEILFEKKVSVFAGECYGTADALLYTQNKLIIIDLKTGRGLISPKDNPQLLCYLLGAMHFLISDKGFTYEQMAYFSFEAVIIQPRDPSVIKSYTYTFAQIRDFKNKLSDAYRVAYNHERVTLNSRIYKKELIDENFKEEDGLKAGSHCKWCAALGVCKTAMKEAMPVRLKKSLSDFPATQTLSIDQIKMLLEKKKAIESFLDSVEKRAIYLLCCTQDIDGFGLRERRTNKRWSNEKEVSQDIKIEFPQLYEDCFTERKLRSPAQLSKLLGAEFIALHTFKPVGEPTVAPTNP